MKVQREGFVTRTNNLGANGAMGGCVATYARGNQGKLLYPIQPVRLQYNGLVLKSAVGS